MTDPEVIRAWFTAHLDEDEELARYLTDQFADPDEFDGGWSLWGNVGRAIDEAVRVDFRRGRALRAIAAKRAIIAALPTGEGYDGDRVRFGDWESCSDSCAAEVMIHVLRQLAQDWADDPTMPAELRLA